VEVVVGVGGEVLVSVHIEPIVEHDEIIGDGGDLHDAAGTTLVNRPWSARVRP
jgi:hypothetical protein